MHTSNSIIIFIRQSLSFSELITSSLSSLDLYSDYLGVNISTSTLPSSRNIFIVGDFNCHYPLQDSIGTSDPYWRKYSTGSSLLAFYPSMARTHLPFSIALLAVAPLLLFLAPGRCFGTWVLITYQFFKLSLSLQSFAPMSTPLPSIFRKLGEMTLPSTLTLAVLLQRNTHLFLFLLQLLSLPLWH